MLSSEMLNLKKKYSFRFYNFDENFIITLKSTLTNLNKDVIVEVKCLRLFYFLSTKVIVTA